MKIQNKITWSVLLAIALIGLLLAAFVGGRLMQGTIRGDSRELTILPSPLLPGGEGETGLFLDRQDNLIRVGTGDIKVHAIFDENGQPTGEFDSRYTGPIVEVVLTGGTVLYKDVTSFPDFVLNSPVSQQTIQQALVPVETLEALTTDTVLHIWGRRSGDRITAETVVYKIH